MVNFKKIFRFKKAGKGIYLTDENGKELKYDDIARDLDKNKKTKKSPEPPKPKDGKS